MIPNWFALVISICIPQTIGILGVFVTRPATSTWYNHMKKAPWSPPKWVFAPTWLTLYTLMGVSSFLIWRENAEKAQDVRPQLTTYAFNLFLNGIWPFIFFGFRAFKLALVDMVLLICSTVACISSFHVISPVAAYLLIPYLAWICLAATINAYAAVKN